MKRKRSGQALKLLFAGLCCCAAVAVSYGSSLDQAQRLHTRIAGTAPSATTLAEMAQLIDDGNALDAAAIALETPEFLSVTLKNFATPKSNIDQTLFAPLNDYTATVIGLIRDDHDFRKVLYGDIIYTADSALGLPGYGLSNNNHYQALESSGESLITALVERGQANTTGLNSDATAGVLTTRTAAQEFFFAGTNRANLRFTLMNYLCKDLEQVKDITLAPDRIRQDVSRSPGGDSRIFMNNCIGCHSGMDPLAQAFAYYEFEYNPATDPQGDNGRLVYNGPGQTDATTGTRVQSKYHNNATTFPAGFVTTDDSWENYWRTGQNQNLGWDSALPGRGQGAKSMGQELAHSQQFARCQVETVFTDMCLRAPKNSADQAQVTNILARFKNSGYKLKQVFGDTAIYCMGE